jgi:hypothetical protein
VTVADEARARKEGERELERRLEDGQSADSALYRSWLRYHNRLGGADPWAAWKERYTPSATKKEIAVKKSVKKAIAAAAPDAPSVPRNVPLRPVSIAGAGQTAVLSPFKQEVDAAEAALARARKSEDAYAIAGASSALREARHRLTAMKLMIAESARERDPAAVMRSLRGQGTPLLTNRHALRDDPSLRGI